MYKTKESKVQIRSNMRNRKERPGGKSRSTGTGSGGISFAKN